MSLVLILSIQQFDKIKNMGKKKVFVVMSLCSRNQIHKVLSVHGVPPTIVVDNWLRLSIQVLQKGGGTMFHGRCGAVPWTMGQEAR